MVSDQPHVPVLLQETLQWLAPRRGGRCCDLTLGGGGHTREFLKAVGVEGFVWGVDRDKEILDETVERLRAEGYDETRFGATHGNFADIDVLSGDRDLCEFDVFFADVGANSAHFDRMDRGFSFSKSANLDMRYDRTSEGTLADLLDEVDKSRLRKILGEGGERFPGRVAHAIIEARDAGRLTDTLALADVVRGAYPAAARRGRIDCATRTFQALRIAVNDELTHLRTGLVKVVNAMKISARLGVISFHSGEDAIVKRLFRAVSEGEKDFYGHRAEPPCRELFRKALFASDEENSANFRARSARLRVIIKEKAGEAISPAAAL